MMSAADKQAKEEVFDLEAFPEDYVFPNAIVLFIAMAFFILPALLIVFGITRPSWLPDGWFDVSKVGWVPALLIGLVIGSIVTWLTWHDLTRGRPLAIGISKGEVLHVRYAFAQRALSLSQIRSITQVVEPKLWSFNRSSDVVEGELHHLVIEHDKGDFQAYANPYILARIVFRLKALNPGIATHREYPPDP
jgi:hypothetical protein